MDSFHAADQEITVGADGLLNDFQLRLGVEEKAQNLGCLEAISGLTVVDAVRLLQQKEQYNPCFGGEFPLVPLPYGTTFPEGFAREKFCGAFECCWRLPCDMHRTMQAGLPVKCHEEEFVQKMDQSIIQVVVDSAPDTRPAHEATQPPDPAATEHAEKTLAGILSQLAESATAFLSAIQELARQSAHSDGTVAGQIDGLKSSLGQLAQEVAAQRSFHAESQGKYDELSAAVAAVRETEADHDTTIRALREDAREREDRINGRLEEISARMEQNHGEYSDLHAKVEGLIPLHSMISNLSSMVDVWCERLGRQEQVLNSLCDMQTRRAAAFQHFSETLARVETSIAPLSAQA